MELVIPDGAQVHITIGHPPLLALPDEARAIAPSTERSRGRLGKSLLVGALLFAAFEAGRIFPHRAESASAAQPPPKMADSKVSEDRDAGDIPRAFRARIAQPPHIVPPPGSAPAAPLGDSTGGPPAPAAVPTQSNPFGLQN